MGVVKKRIETVSIFQNTLEKVARRHHFLEAKNFIFEVLVDKFVGCRSLR